MPEPLHKLHRPPSSEHMFANHKIDVKALRELGGLASVGGSPEPGVQFDRRAVYLLDKSGGDVHVAAELARTELNRINDNHKRTVADNLDHYIAEAKDEDKRRFPDLPRSPSYLEAARAYDPATGKYVTVLQPGHYSTPSRYAVENGRRFSPRQGQG